MTDIDLALARLAAAPVPAALNEIDDAVFAGIAKRRQEASLAPRLMGLAATLSLAIGVVGGSISVGAPVSAQSLSPFAVADALTPATLLDIRP